MKLLTTLTLVALIPFVQPVTVSAQGAAQAAEGGAASDLPSDVADAVEEETEEGLLIIDATETDLDSFLWQMRAIVLFANTPADPAFEQQLRAIRDRAAEFVERDVVVILDTDPAAGSDARLRLRPRGFMMAIIDKDGEVKQRRPSPRSARELIAVIDRFPLRRQEMLERRPSGRD